MKSFLAIYISGWTIISVALAQSDIHTKMTSDQLFQVFNVENIDNIPKYELVRLVHQGTKHQADHIVRKRSVYSMHESNGRMLHHVKKDLSKPTYSKKLKLQSIQSHENGKSDDSYSEKLKQFDISQIKEHNVSITAFGEVLNLKLKPTKGLFKNGPNSLRMWMAHSESNATQGVKYEEIYTEKEAIESENIGEVFQDVQNMGAILIRRHPQTGDLLMEGSIGHDIVIKPLPHEFSSNKSLAQHIIYKRDIDNLDHLSDFAYMEPDQFEPHSTSNLKSSKNVRIKRGVPLDADTSSSTFKSNPRTKRAAPFMIYPEILVIVDYDGYRLHGGDNVQVKRYFVSFWNGVDLRYRLLKGPRIRISIAGIIISRGRDATPYLERNRVGRDAIDSAAALTDMGKYLFRERRLPVYDIAVAITKLDMCRRAYAYGECKRGTAGFAYVGGACVVNKRLEKVNSVAIIEDTGGFSGIIVAAHEVGHLLGAVHDGSPPPSYLGGPGAERCRWEDGYIMSDLRHTERGFRWSPCTVQSFHHFLNGDTASCLHNAPHEVAALGRSLPGTLLSLDAQCRRDRGTYACFKDDRVCAQLFCFDAQTGYCVAYRPAAEGSPCGNGSHCLDGRCVSLHSNVISDYGPQYRTSYAPTTTELPSISQQDEPESYSSEDEQPDDVKQNYPTTSRNYIFGKRSTTTTRGSFFDTYFRKSSSTTRSPHNFGHFEQFFKNRHLNNNHKNLYGSISRSNQTKTQPPDATNYLGDNSNNSPILYTTSGSGND